MATYTTPVRGKPNLNYEGFNYILGSIRKVNYNSNINDITRISNIHNNDILRHFHSVEYRKFNF